mgnify:CR=1 FL=1
MNDRIIRITLNFVGVSVPSVLPLEYSTHEHLAPASGSFPAKRHVDARVIQPGLIEQTMFGTGKLRGASPVNAGAIVLNNADGNFLFRMGENTAVILDPKSAAGTATKPVGTGPFKLEDWKKGSSITLVKNADYRAAAAVKMKKVSFRFINDPAAQVAALLAGDIDGMPRFGAPQNLKQFQGDKRFTVEIGGTEGKTIVSINNRKKPFDDVRVRRAIAAAIDRKAVIQGAGCFVLLQKGRERAARSMARRTWGLSERSLRFRAC